MSHLFDAVVIPRRYARIVRWAEAVFLVPSLLMIAFLPFPPHRTEFVSFVVLSLGILAACFVWWGLRSPTRIAWWTALVLASAWLLNSTRFVYATLRVIVRGLTGHHPVSDFEAGLLWVDTIVLLTVATQGIILIAWYRGSMKRNT
jgi:hypothetical protein